MHACITQKVFLELCYSGRTTNCTNREVEIIASAGLQILIPLYVRYGAPR